MTEQKQDVILKVENLKQYFKVRRNVIKAVDDVSFEVKRGEVFGLVGESGCGKTTTGRTIIKLYEPTAGNVWFNGYRIGHASAGSRLAASQARTMAKAQLKEIERGERELIAAKPAEKAEILEKHAGMRRAVEAQLENELRDIARHAEDVRADKVDPVAEYRRAEAESLKAQYAERKAALQAKISGGNAEEAAAAKAELEEYEKIHKLDMEFVNKSSVMNKMQMIFQDPIASINPRMTVREIIAEGLIIRGVKDKAYIDRKVYEVLDQVGLVPEHASRYPHEFSGGQRQRIGIARAIILEPDLIIADEPISALDVSIQAQVINLLNDLREKLGLTILFIAHNLSVVKYFCDRIAVMYYGKIVEMADARELFAHPLHPYTKSLLSAIPYPDPHYEKSRKRIAYHPALVHDYAHDKPRMVEAAPGHFVYCNEAELQKYRAELTRG